MGCQQPLGEMVYQTEDYEKTKKAVIMDDDMQKQVRSQVGIMYGGAHTAVWLPEPDDRRQ